MFICTFLGCCIVVSLTFWCQGLCDAHPFAFCCNCYSSIMLPTHDELVLIAATNQPAVQAVEEAVGTPAVLPGRPDSTVGNSCVGRHPIRRVECFQRRTGRCHSGTRHCQHLHDGLGKRDPTHPPGTDVLSHGSGRFGDTMLWGSWCALGALGWDVSTTPPWLVNLNWVLLLRIVQSEYCQFLP